LFISPGLIDGCGQAEGIFYALAYNDAGQSKPAVVREVTVSVPAKPGFLSIIKSNNYMSNALCVLEARAKGGYMGVQLSSQGHILESAVANICAVLKGGRLLTPPADQVLAGTTIRRVLELAEMLVEEGLLSSAGRGLFTAEEAKEGEELMLVGGDGLVGISHLDEVAIGSGTLGPVTKRLKELLDRDKS
jgi:branched-subunit amino acid aminotransferase/4-amino-4-deoxychorismate lyase